MPSSMRAVRVHTPGGLEAVVLDEVPVPAPRPGWVLVRMEAAGLNFSDTVRRQDRYAKTSFPFTFGSEAAGPIVALGEGVEDFRVGERVTGVIPGRGGGYADYVEMSAAHLVRIPAGMGAVEAVAVPNQGATAWCLLHEMTRIAPAERVLVDAAGGGVGLWAIQLARAAGAGFVAGVASTAEKRAAATAAGADLALDHADPAWPEQVRAAAGGGVDIFLDSVGGPLFAQGFDLTVPFGRTACYGLASGQPASVTPSAQLVFTCRTVAGFHLDQVMAQPARFRAILGQLFALVAEGKVAPRIAGVFPLEQARDAQALLESRDAVGKVVLVP
jgi:NADPH2:quinone reductase